MPERCSASDRRNEPHASTDITASSICGHRCSAVHLNSCRLVMRSVVTPVSAAMRRTNALNRPTAAPINREPKNMSRNSPLARRTLLTVTSRTRNPVTTLCEVRKRRSLNAERALKSAPKEGDGHGVVEDALAEHVGVEIGLHVQLLEDGERSDGVSGGDDGAKDEALEERERRREAAQYLRNSAPSRRTEGVPQGT